MKHYKHPKLGRVAYKGSTSETYNVNNGKSGDDYNYWYFEWSVEELLALGFEEVSDDIGKVEKDWIDECVHDIFEYQRGRPKEDETDTVSVRRIIEKHMPKQKKFTKEEVIERRVNLVRNNHSTVLFQFLRDHGQLEE